MELLEVAMIYYSFHHDYLLIGELNDLSKEEQKERRNYMLAKKLLNPMLYILAGSLSLFNSVTSWVVISIVIITPCIHRLIGLIFRKCKFVRVAGADFDLMFGNYIDTERVECFSDGVFSIVATLLVLDITTESFPSATDVTRNGIDLTVLQMWPKFLVYAENFIVIALLWFIHHSLFHCIKKMNQFMLVCNNISLAFVGFFPCMVAILNKFADEPKKPDDNTRLAVQCGSVVIFMTSMFQAAVFVAALWKGPTHLEPKVNPAVSKTSHYHLTLKLAILPVISLSAYYIAITASDFIIYVAYHVAVFVTPFLFFALKFFWGGREVGVLRHDVAMDPDLETWVPPPHRSRLRLQKNFVGDTTLSQSLAC
ncbi:Transmembrane protein 175 [Stylophora pistillata]|uniref:Endosomal/lysosomal proton channel TMEM175 n=1 Tax=Stylophora pistillata TaxID=50429 RepID=A0A2B4RXL9_STYPI|nr:Transmembrane protein 175 [Stylophora pistillata]